MKPFKFENVTNFDDHILKSIPSFTELNFLVQRLAHDFAQEGTMVVDVGCSTGRLLRSLDKRDGVWYYGIDLVMRPEEDGRIRFVRGDAFWKLPCLEPQKKCSVIISMFTMQFMPYEIRKEFLQIVESRLCNGGIFICAEKMHFSNPCIESVVQANLLEWKLQHFTKEEVLDKTIGLKSVMYCQTREDLVNDLNFNVGSTDAIWQWGQFGAFVSRKVTK
jgi:tRNA (cmo5U34)-methyltransferase